MEARKLLDAAPYCPQTVEVLKRALDEAWSSIASTTSPDLVENTRLSLAHAIVAHAGLGSTDREGLKSAAIVPARKPG
jgi:predicted Zn-dependent protease with MMP-like domain